MRASSLFALTAAFLPSALSVPLSPPPIRTRSIDVIPPDFYESQHPLFAGAPIILSDPLPTASPVSPGPGRYAISYTPYTADGLCKTYDTVTSDIARIHRAGFSVLRLYATDCRAVRSVGLAAVANGMRMILGLHISEDGVQASSIDEQVLQIKDFVVEDEAHLTAIDAVIVGNEAIFNRFATVEEVTSALSEVRSTLRDAGYLGPVTTTEPYGTLLQYADALCLATDMIAANLLPFFHADVAARAAGDLVRDQMAVLETLCDPPAEDLAVDGFATPVHPVTSGTKPVLALEIAWPSAGQANGLAVPGRAEQRLALAGMSEAIGSRAVFSSFEDDGWRDAGDFGVETHWGSIEVFE
ncbi:hypothetical protein ANO11243_033410 [Dothideomycetidae sp. 11243]|nr:hypothetical protein ANO11243_033410 [fungal sp. No.11243]